MVKITCKRCGAEVPKSSTRGSALFGGRICAPCAAYMGKRIQAAGTGFTPQPKTVAPKVVEKKQGFFSRVAEKFLRRRGVR